MLLAAKLFSKAALCALAGAWVPDCRPPWNWPGGAARPIFPTGHRPAQPPLREQEPPGWLKAVAIAALLLALATFSLAAALF
jgi:hypothetical protein